MATPYTFADENSQGSCREVAGEFVVDIIDSKEEGNSLHFLRKKRERSDFLWVL